MAGKQTAAADGGNTQAPTDLTAVLTRLDALEDERAALFNRVADLEKVLKDGEAITDLETKLNELATTVAGHTETLAAETARMLDGEGIVGELVEGYDPRGELLKAFRQIEAIANHSNIQLPG